MRTFTPGNSVHEGAAAPSHLSHGDVASDNTLSLWTFRARLLMGLMESVSAIERYPEVSCGESVLMSQMVSTWSNHVGEVLGMMVQNGVPHIDHNVGDDSIYLPFLRGFHSRGFRRVARPLDGVMEVSEHALRPLVPFARCPKRDAAKPPVTRYGACECGRPCTWSGP